MPDIVAAYIDPFCANADGSRYPDDFRGYSSPFVTNFEYNIVTQPTTGVFRDLNQIAVVPDTGSAVFLITPDPSNLIVQGLVGTPPTGFFAANIHTFNWPNGILFTNAAQSLNAFGPGTGLLNNDFTISNIGPFRSSFSSARLVAGGVKITSTMNFSAVSGTIRMVPVFVNLSVTTSNNASQAGGAGNPETGEMQNGWQAQLPSNVSDMANLPGYVETSMSALEGDELVGIFKRYGPEAKLFKPTATAWGIDENSAGTLATRHGDANLPDSYGHYCLLVFIDGVLNAAGTPPAASTPLALASIRMHYECEPTAASNILNERASGGGDIQGFSPEYQPILMAAADNLCVDIPPVRVVDDAGVEELGFIEECGVLWNSACKVAGAVTAAVGTAARLLSAFVL